MHPQSNLQESSNQNPPEDGEVTDQNQNKNPAFNNGGEIDNDSYGDEERDQEIQNQINAFMNMRNFLHEKLQSQGPSGPENNSQDLQNSQNPQN